MTVIRTRAKLIEGFRIAVDDGRSHSSCVDLPPDLGTDRGPTALELGVMSFAGCVATIFVLMARKTRVNIRALEIIMDAEKPEGAKTVTKADYAVVVTSDESEDKLRRVFELTRANCPVGVLFEKAGVEVSYKLEILK